MKNTFKLLHTTIATGKVDIIFSVNPTAVLWQYAIFISCFHVLNSQSIGVNQWKWTMRNYGNVKLNNSLFIFFPEIGNTCLWMQRPCKVIQEKWYGQMTWLIFITLFPFLPSCAFKPCPDRDMKEKSPDLGWFSQLKASSSCSLNAATEYKDLLCLQWFYVDPGSLEIPDRGDYKRGCEKSHLSDTEGSTTDFRWFWPSSKVAFFF